jgi:hypothetical protein
MSVTCAIFIDQPGGGGNGPAGFSLIGSTGHLVTWGNGNNAGPVVQWTFEIIDVPRGSAVLKGVVQDGATPTHSFNPDIDGGYHLHLTVRDAFGNLAEDRRVFQVPQASGRIIPPFQATGDALNFTIPGDAGPNLRGWARLQEDYDKYIDTVVTIESGGAPVGSAGTVNFTGAGQTGSLIGGIPTINIPGGGGGAVFDTVLQAGNANQPAFTNASNVFVVFAGLTASRTCTMPAAPGTGQRVGVKIADASGLSFGVSVAGNGNPIGSAAATTYAIVGGGVCVVFEFDGTTWQIIGIGYPAIPPLDAADQIRWSFSEAAHSVGGQFANSGAAAALRLSTNAGRGGDTTGDAASGPVGQGYSHQIAGGVIQPNILFAPDPGVVSAWPANPLSTTIGESVAAFTMHGWINPRSYPAGGGGTQVLCYKVYNAASWAAPFIAVGLTMLEPPAGGATAGDWQGYVANLGVLNNGQVLASSTGSVFTIPLNQWTHLALTFTSASGARLYFNGEFTGVTIASGGQPIDFGTHGPWEMLGETTSDAQFFDGSIEEWRIANVARSDAYLRAYVHQTLKTLPMVA